MIGLRLQEWTARDAADRNVAMDQRRRLQWKLRQLSNVSVTGAIPPTNQIDIMLGHQNEVDGIDAVLRATGQALEPPAEWQPPQSAPASTAKILP